MRDGETIIFSNGLHSGDLLKASLLYYPNTSKFTYLVGPRDFRRSLENHGVQKVQKRRLKYLQHTSCMDSHLSSEHHQAKLRKLMRIFESEINCQLRLNAYLFPI